MRYKGKNPPTRVLSAVDWTVFAFLALGLCLVLSHYATLHYDFFDMSALMDSGYRVYKGQDPYLDFFYFAGPIHLYLHALFFKIFGFTKAAIIAHLCFGATVFAAAVFRLCRPHFSLLATAFLDVFCTLCFYGTIAHPWYDQNATLFIVLGLLVFETGYPFANDGQTAKAGFLMGCLSALSFMTKSNIGLAGIGLFGALFAVAAYRAPAPQRVRLLAWAYIAGLFCGYAVILLTLKAPDKFFSQVFLTASVNNRLKNFSRLWSVLRETPYCLMLGAEGLVLFLGGRKLIVEQRLLITTLTALIFSSIFAAWTGFMLIPANITLVGLEAVYLIRLAKLVDAASGISLAGLGIARSAQGAAWALTAVLFLIAIAKTQVSLAWTWHPSNFRATYALKTKGFEGWMCDRDIGEGVDKTVDYINRNVPAQDSLFVFPDATVIYGMTGHESYRGAPFAYCYGRNVSAPPPGKASLEFLARFLSAPPEWFVLHRQTEMGSFDWRLMLKVLRLDSVVAANYKLVWRWGDFDVLRLQPGKR